MGTGMGLGDIKDTEAACPSTCQSFCKGGYGTAGHCRGRCLEGPEMGGGLHPLGPEESATLKKLQSSGLNSKSTPTSLTLTPSLPGALVS